MPFPLTTRSFWILFCMSFCSAALSAGEGFVPLRTEGPMTYYEGTATLGGKVERRADEAWLELMGDLVCFEAAPASKALIPRAPDDSRTAWFCFDNPKEALRLLNLPAFPVKGTCGYEAQATVRVSRYVVNRLESEVTDTARLLKVVTRGPLRSIKCL
jgi:hypothetical protein